MAYAPGAAAGATALGIASVLAPVAGSIIQNVGSARQAVRAQTFSERMRNTAHQAEIKDLIAAGLNPVLSAGGSGASSPEGVFYQPENMFRSTGEDIRRAIDKRAENVGKWESAGLSSALKSKAEAEIDNVKATNDLIRAQQSREKSAARLNDANAVAVRSSIPEKQARSEVGASVKTGIDTLKKGIERAGAAAGKIWIDLQRKEADYKASGRKLEAEMARKGYRWNTYKQEWEKIPTAPPYRAAQN
jgi:hypothetical protein